MMQTTQKDSFFKIIDSLKKYVGVWKPVCFDLMSFWYELRQWNFEKSLHLNKKNILGFSFFKSSMWNYLLVHT